MSLDETIAVVQKNLRNAKDRSIKLNEAAVRETVVMPILDKLGWDIMDSDIVQREYSLENRRVDYALCPSNRSKVFMEVKATGHLQGGDKQLFEYAFHEGVPLAILTDGKEWCFYLPGEQGSYNDRRFYKLDMLERSNTEVAERLIRYLEFSRIKDDTAIIDARSDYQDANRKRAAKSTIQQAFHEIIEEPDDLFTDILTEKVQSICGYAPEKEDVIDYLANLTLPNIISIPKATPKIEKTSRIAHNKNTSPRVVSYIFYGKQCSASNAAEAMIQVLESLSAMDNNFFEIMVSKVKGKKRNHLSRNKEQVYPSRPDLNDSVKKIGNTGWWVGTNISNREKEKILQQACDTARLTYGKDLVISLTN